MNLDILAKPWTQEKFPKRILAIRLQALGDMVITLPYLQGLKNKHPQIVLHFLTRHELRQIPQSLKLFDQVIVLKGGRNAKIQFILSLLLVPLLWWNRYDMVLDLQNNKITRTVRKLLVTKAWSQFDKTSPVSAGERTRKTLLASGIPDVLMQHLIPLKDEIGWQQLLMSNGWDKKSKLILLNPAGNLPSRNWPVENYIRFAQLWDEGEFQVVLMLQPPHQQKASQIQQALGGRCIDLSGKTSLLDAFSLVKKSYLMLSEDSGLMHMAWVQGVPTLALFGSSRKDWSAPLGDHSRCLDSSDLDCGPCMLATCIYDDNRCLTRYSPQLVYDQCQQLLTALER